MGLHEGIISARVERMASEKPSQGKPAAFDQAVF